MQEEHEQRIPSRRLPITGRRSNRSWRTILPLPLRFEFRAACHCECCLYGQPVARPAGEDADLVLLHAPGVANLVPVGEVARLQLEGHLFLFAGLDADAPETLEFELRAIDRR